MVRGTCTSMDDDGAAADEDETEEVAKVEEELDCSATETELDAEVDGAADEAAATEEDTTEDTTDEEDDGAAVLDEAAVLETVLDALLEELAALDEEALLEELELTLAPTDLQTLEKEFAAVSALLPHLDFKQEDISEDSLLQTQAI
ncbi:hypothetical protein KL918_003273 [Ogataea parapolymorpha]|nr:hypothetical protein KL918_003273 [Ogataea parapolymorpha]KAG7872442.1 hypothetical protein KL916_003177 [Ogataea parapolymorpha]